ncbi:MAG TPA: bifunctional riboflavin kinase/FAD synthetase [Dongiaceae bacterium]|nr:bifunctional riboflavin kinase/FAD synthetase [Dongiaceae bacterium]
MRLLRHFEDVPAELKGAVIAIGNFDGVHRGHQAVLAQARGEARRRNAKLGVLTFEPHPRSFFRPGEPPFRLTPFRIKMRHLRDLGVDVAFVLPFDREMSQRSAETFITDVLVKGLGAAHVVVGSDFCFGKGRSGNATVLAEAGKRLGFGVTALSLQGEPGGKPGDEDEGAVYSSTLVRDRLLGGDPLAAALALDRPWEIEGRVEHGDKRGRTIGFPTANLHLGEFMQPRLGVYAVKAAVDSGHDLQWIDGVANLGRRPTVAGEDLRFEVHLFDFSGDLYGKHLRVALLGFIRPEMKFSGLDQLKAQIAADCDTARRMLAEYRGPAPGTHPAAAPLVEEPQSARK